MDDPNNPCDKRAHRQSRSSTKPFIIKWIREKQRKQKTRYRPWNQVIQSPFIVLSDYPSLVTCCAKTSFLRSLAKNGSQDRFLTRSLHLARSVLFGLSLPSPFGPSSLRSNVQILSRKICRVMLRESCACASSITLSCYPSLAACCAKTSFLRSLAKNGSQDRFLTRSLQLARPVLLGLSCPRPAGRRHCLPTFKSFPEGFVA